MRKNKRKLYSVNHHHYVVWWSNYITRCTIKYPEGVELRKRLDDYLSTLEAA